MAEPQFIAPSAGRSTEHSIEVSTILIALFSPLVFAVVFFFWLALDNPPLPVIPLVICIGSFVFGVAAATSILRTRGVPLIPAVLLGIFAVPCMLIAASFFVIAVAFSLGSLF